jgi:RNA polymerase sigma factor (sigma-70 family)
MSRVEPEVSQDPLDAVYRQELGPMVRLAHLLVGSNDVARDLVHDVFVKLGPRLGSVDNAAAYLRTSVVNECRMWHRRNATVARHRPTLVAEAANRVSLPPELDETWSALMQVPPRQRLALVLRYYEDLTLDDVAEAMSCRTGTAKSLIHRGLESLKEVLDHGD